MLDLNRQFDTDSQDLWWDLPFLEQVSQHQLLLHWWRCWCDLLALDWGDTTHSPPPESQPHRKTNDDRLVGKVYHIRPKGPTGGMPCLVKGHSITDWLTSFPRQIFFSYHSTITVDFLASADLTVAECTRPGSAVKKKKKNKQMKQQKHF